MSAIRQQVNIAAPVRAVWNALSTAEGLQSWWVDEARIEAREGGRIVLTSEGDDGAPIEERGMFHVFRPTRLIEIAWDSHAKNKTAGTRIQFLLARDGEETRVNVTHSGSGLLDDEAERAVLEKAWKGALASLRDSLET
jgi:uncharacterized protein YndB with AHSA1/START domain